MKDKRPTYSVRKGGTTEQWLDSKGQWGAFEKRKRFPTQDAAELQVFESFGEDFHNYGLFPNS